MMVEVKSSVKASLNKHLSWFQQKTGAKYAFQVTMNQPYVEADCFAVSTPVKIPVETLLMRLV